MENWGFWRRLWVFLWASLGWTLWSGEMGSIKSKHQNESIWEKDFVKWGGLDTCVWSEEAVGDSGISRKIGPSELIERRHQSTPALSVCCQCNTTPRIERTREGFSNWHNSQALREKGRSAEICFLQMFWNSARCTHKRKLAPTSPGRRYISLNCSHNS